MAVLRFSATQATTHPFGDESTVNRPNAILKRTSEAVCVGYRACHINNGRSSISSLDASAITNNTWYVFMRRGYHIEVADIRLKHEDDAVRQIVYLSACVEVAALSYVRLVTEARPERTGAGHVPNLLVNFAGESLTTE